MRDGCVVGSGDVTTKMRSWQTDDVGRRDRFAYWREAVCEAFLDLRPETGNSTAFRGRIDAREFSTIGIARIEASAQRVVRKPTDDLRWSYLNFQASGTGLARQGNKSVKTHPGDAVIVRTDRPYELAFDGDFVQYSLRLPSALLPLAEEPIHLRQASGAGQAVGALLSLTFPEYPRDDTPSDPVDDWLETALIDLVAAATAKHRWGRQRNALETWTMISNDIDRHLRSPLLTPSATASRVGLSLRGLHERFENRDRSFASEVRHRRLVAARRQLIADSDGALRILDIAISCGFSDLSHFHRVYRAEFGVTPGATRRHAKAGDL